MVSVGVRAVEEISGDVIRVPEAVAGIDALVEEGAEGFGALRPRQGGDGVDLGVREGFAELEMDAALGLADAGQDAVEVLAGLLDVLDAGLFDQGLACLQEVAGLLLMRRPRHLSVGGRRYS